MNDIDKLLRTALSPARYPSEELNNKIVKKVKESGNMKNNYKKMMIAAAITMVLLILPVTVYAAYRYLSPKEAAKEMDDKKLGDAFDKEGKEVIKTVTDGMYKITYLGHVTGKSISERTGSAWELHPDRIYVAVAIERADGADIKEDDGHSILVTPLIQGLNPWKYNIVTMNGGYMEKIIDGILYRITECDNIGIFADKELYLAVSDTNFYSTEAFDYDEETGLITEKDSYQGTNVLFKLELDPKGANKEKAAEYIEKFEKEWESGGDTEKSSGENQELNSNTEEDPRVQQEEFYDKENNLTIRIKDNDSAAWSASGESSNNILSYSLEVEGEGVENLDFSLNKGQFCNYTEEYKLGERDYYGNTLSVPYKEQKERAYKYAIAIKAKYTDYGYEEEYLKELGEKDIEQRNKLYYEVLNEEINATIIGLDIKMEDGRVLHKEIKLKNVLEKTERSIWIALTVN
ncbi:hypothetical protein R2R35_15935 [Anaerocolumna sp. AGMB13020]|uniref:hypothetical protein n=1 Tax=Anaerocolumna sp. AGMB13020 TaxID=3081750 RepID=UPI0029533ED5|nr:hypothetical protein [Anaerocolumna sp. AGMB13020]WOO35279.1 hypothetical protein R2R35_15935 [Anaerocolumna sp. AGMB13020]